MAEKSTIKEIAKSAGVSVSTVSRVLNNRSYVDPRTRERVTKVILQMNYTPNANAKLLRQLESNNVAVIVRGVKNIFFSGILEEFHKYIPETGLSLVPHYIDEDADEIAAAQRVYAEHKVRGIVFLGGYHEGRADILRRLPVPCVFSTVSAEGVNAENVSSVCVDDRMGARRAADYILERGHKRIVILGANPESSYTAKRRYMGLKDSFSAHNMDISRTKQLISSFSFESAYEQINGCMEDDYTAVIAMSDTMAIGAMRALWAKGRSVPEDVSVIGFDGIDLANFTVPPLTTIRQPRELLARKSIELLTEGMLHTGSHIKLEAELIEGASVRNLI